MIGLSLLAACGSAPAALQTATGAPTATAPAPAIQYVPGSARKVCQLTGETDRHFRMPTVNQTAPRVGLEGTDLGSSFEHDGKLFFLFGNSIPTPTFNGKPNGPGDPPRIPDDNDAIASTTDTSVTPCPHLDFIRSAVAPTSPACDDLSAPNRLGEAGGGYGPYFLSRYTTGDAARGASTFFFTLATWNPYTQVIMQATIQAAP